MTESKTEKVNIWAVETIGGNRYHVTSKADTVEGFQKVLDNCNWLSTLDREKGNWVLRTTPAVKTDCIETAHLSITKEEVHYDKI